MNILLPRICLAFTGCLFSLIVVAKTEQFNTPTGTRPGTQPTVPLRPTVPVQQTQPVQPPQPVQPVFNYKKLNAGLQYAFIINKLTSPNPKEGDQISVNMQKIKKN